MRGQTIRRIYSASVLVGRNPALFVAKIVARLGQFLPLPAAPVRKKINGVVFEFDFALDPRVREMYLGSYELETVFWMKRLVPLGGTVIDVGDNIGYLSAVAMGLVGPAGQVHSFEPVSEYFERLESLARRNPQYRLVVNRCALGDTTTTATIATSRLANIGWNTMVPGFMTFETVKRTINVQTHRLDSYIRERQMKNISLIKIDAEGYEFPILRGLQSYFEAARTLPPILCEIAPTAYPLLGATTAELAHYLRACGYFPLSTMDGTTPIDLESLRVTTDVLLLPAGR